MPVSRCDAYLKLGQAERVIVNSSFFFLAESLLTPIVPLYTHQLGATAAVVGLAGAVFSLPGAILGFALGGLSDRVGRKRMIVVSASLWFVASVGLMLSTDVIQVVLAWGLAGLGLATMRPASSALLSEVTKIRRLGRAHGTQGSIEGLQAAIGPLLGGIIASLYGLASVFIFSAGLAVLALASTLTLPEVLRKDRNVEVNKTDVQNRSWIKPSMPIWSAVFTFGFVSSVILSLFPVYIIGLGMSAAVVGLLLSVRQIVNLLARIPVGIVFDRWRSTWGIISIGMISSIASMALLGFLSDLLGLMILMGLAGLSRAMVMTSSNAELAKKVPREHLGVSAGGVQTSLMGGRTVGPASIGELISRTGFTFAFLITSLIGTVGLSLIWIYLSKTTRPSTETSV